MESSSLEITTALINVDVGLIWYSLTLLMPTVSPLLYVNRVLVFGFSLLSTTFLTSRDLECMATQYIWDELFHLVNLMKFITWRSGEWE